MMFDTDVIIWAIRGNVNAAKAIDSAGAVCISTVTYIELIEVAQSKEDLRRIKSYLTGLKTEVIPLNENIGHRAVIYVEEYGLKTGMKLPDALIAATAAEKGMELCAGNVKDFREIKELKIKPFRA
ncbi:MAG TPA: type II toxin-antitoxin system VapC family toxin [Candidatus Goldiibacteriota bacterium]|nr:type II toxin-antitoxin system VapC family toxin [Candidatus Goldiibacteriota bacterium]